MSYGFLAYQLPQAPEHVYEAKDFEKKFNVIVDADRLFRIHTTYYLALSRHGKRIVFRVPPVWVLTLRSGCNKTNVKPKEDILKLGLADGVMHMHTPKGHTLDPHIKSSFDTKVILAHALGNAIVATISAYENKNPAFVHILSTRGMGIAHWHGYVNKEHIPHGWHAHGHTNPHVACSSAQSSIYAIQGKLDAFEKALENHVEFKGDIHIEPHHGTNIMYPSLIELADHMKKDADFTTLGNTYL
jgi:hypothetical protein